MAREAAKHPAPLREALPEAPSRPDTKGGVAAAASLRRSRSPESPRLRRRLRLLLSLQLFPALSVSGLWCSAGGGSSGGGGGGSRGGGSRRCSGTGDARVPAPRALSPGGVMAEYGTLLQDLTNNITLEDLEQLKSACKEDIPSEKSEEITTGSAWFSFLESHNKLDKDNLSYIEHIFEISRRPDLLTMVVDYRTRVLKISEEDELDTKLTRIPSAKKYKDIIRQPSEEEIIKLAPPPKKA